MEAWVRQMMMIWSLVAGRARVPSPFKVTPSNLPPMTYDWQIVFLWHWWWECQSNDCNHKSYHECHEKCSWRSDRKRSKTLIPLLFLFRLSSRWSCLSTLSRCRSEWLQHRQYNSQTNKRLFVCLLCVCLGTDNKNVPRQPCYLYYSHQIWVCIQASGLWRHILRASILLSDTRSSYVDAKLVVGDGNSKIRRVVVRSI